MFKLGLVLCVAFVLMPFFSYAQTSGLSLSVTPTLFEMSASPLQVWNSSVKVINNNPYEITVYASVANFAPQGETGQGKFIPVFENFTEGATLAEWIDISNESFTVPAEKSVSVPFTVRVPEDASPGGHFAAIMIGTKPPETGDKLNVQTSQIVTSLFFVRVAGDVIEDGSVREFRSTKSFVQEPKVDFSVRFKNKGNVHIQPQGEIIITNMWGKERGVIPINQQTHFGNVLPDSIRNFEFSWRGEQSFSDIGRYKSVLTLAYGTQNRKFETSVAYFWLVPIKPVLTVLISVALFVLFITWAIKAYIRRMLALSGYTYTRTAQRPLMREGDVLIEKKDTSIQSPLTAGYEDLKKRLKNTKAFIDVLKVLFAFVLQYKLFFGAAVLFGIFVFVGWYFMLTATKTQKNYEVTINNGNTGTTLSSEEIIYEKENPNTQNSQVTSEKLLVAGENETAQQSYSLVIVNSSDTPGLAADLRERLEDRYVVNDLRSDFGTPRQKTTIVYHPDLQKEALSLSKELNGALLSAIPEATDETFEIVIYIGNDYSRE